MKEERSCSNHFKIAYRVDGQIYDVLWISVSQKRELFIVTPALKKYKKTKMPLYDNGDIVEKNANIDHITFHNTGRVHCRVKAKKGKKHIFKKKSKNTIF